MTEEAKPQSTAPRAGALKSTLSIELHSHYAIRLWEGRLRGEAPDAQGRKRPEIISMPKALYRAGRIYQDGEADNPYADAAMYALEQTINAAAGQVELLVAEVAGILKALPAGITLTPAASVSPLNIGVYSSSPLGYRCVWLLVGYDQLALNVFQAHHYGLISRKRRDSLLNQGGHFVRRVYAIVQSYNSQDITREDIIHGTAAARDVVSRSGMPDPGIMSGKLRSIFSPPLRRVTSAPATLNAPAATPSSPAGLTADIADVSAGLVTDEADVPDAVAAPDVSSEPSPGDAL